MTKKPENFAESGCQPLQQFEYAEKNGFVLEFFFFFSKKFQLILQNLRICLFCFVLQARECVVMTKIENRISNFNSTLQ
jgi:hypothetical protein